MPDNGFRYLSKEFSEVIVISHKQDKLLRLVKQRGVYPYEYMNSSKDRRFAISWWFWRFYLVCLEYYGLDPCYYFSVPGLKRDAMLKMTGVELELISDIDMYLFGEKGMRGGISYIAKRYNKVNNKYIKSYDDCKLNKYITYLDADKLYGWAIIQCFLYSGLKWLGQKKVDRFDVNLINEKNFHEYILEIDFEYHDELHRLHNHHPLALEKLEISRDMLSRYCNDFADKYGTKTGGVNKLVPNLGKKGYVRYVLH